MKIVAKVTIAPALMQLFTYLKQSTIDAVSENNTKGIKVSIPFNENWIHLILSRHTETSAMTLMVQGSNKKDGPILFEFVHDGRITSVKELQKVLISLIRQAVNEFGTIIAAKLLSKALSAMKRRNIIEGEPA